MEILQKFGFEPVLFAAQIVNFLILAFIFKKFLYKPILKVLHDREHKIKKGLEDAENAAKNLTLAEEKKDAILKSASKEAEKIISDTKGASETLKEKILTEAKIEAEKIIKTAKAQADLQIEAIEYRAKKASLDNSIAILDKILTGMFTPGEKEKIIERNIKTLQKND